MPTQPHASELFRIYFLFRSDNMLGAQKGQNSSCSMEADSKLSYSCSSLERSLHRKWTICLALYISSNLQRAMQVNSLKDCLWQHLLTTLSKNQR